MKKTALVLSGGGSRGAYEIGVWKALKTLGIQIDMVMGTSVGAINGAMIVQDDLNLAENLWLQLET
ncbi:MAG: patatin-like phospholipase family protein, partial [Lentihominibacter sp.]